MFHPDEMKLVYFALLFCWVVVCPLGWAGQDDSFSFFFFWWMAVQLKSFQLEIIKKQNNQESIWNGRKNRERERALIKNRDDLCLRGLNEFCDWTELTERPWNCWLFWNQIMIFQQTPLTIYFWMKNLWKSKKLRNATSRHSATSECCRIGLKKVVCCCRGHL